MIETMQSNWTDLKIKSKLLVIKDFFWRLCQETKCWISKPYIYCPLEGTSNDAKTWLTQLATNWKVNNYKEQVVQMKICGRIILKAAKEPDLNLLQTRPWLHIVVSTSYPVERTEISRGFAFWPIIPVRASSLLPFSIFASYLQKRDLLPHGSIIICIRSFQFLQIILFENSMVS